VDSAPKFPKCTKKNPPDKKIIKINQDGNKKMKMGTKKAKLYAGFESV